MSKIFISFRNGDEPFGAVVIQLVLESQFGAHNVFRSSDSIAAGEDYVERLTEAVRDCQLLLAVIGTRWMTVADPRGRPRIHCAEDWVYRELAQAFAMGKRVLPVLIGGAKLPPPMELPPEIAQLGRLQYRRLEHRQFRSTMALICADVRDCLPGIEPFVSTGRARQIRGPSRQYQRPRR